MNSNLYRNCWEYLSNQHCVLWGQYFDVEDPKGRAQAAAWLAEVIEEVTKIK